MSTALVPVGTVSLVLDSVSSPHSRRAYARALGDFLAWYRGGPFSKALVQQYRVSLEQSGLAPSTINVRLAAIRKLAAEAADNGLLAPDLAAGISRVRGVRRSGVRAGNWLTRDQARALLESPPAGTLKGQRDRAILALLLGCGLRRSEVAGLEADFQQREGRWVIADLVGKGSRIRTIPVPAWVKAAIDGWTAAAGVTAGRLFRSLTKGGAVGESLSEKAVWSVVESAARRIGVERLAPHDLRRTCAKLCRAAGGELEQIQLLLGHASIATTDRYLGSRLDLARAVNDDLGIV
ncbi:MAG: tyrosine-type recombinase/integrase [Bryobacteraceae bacterium]